MISDSSLRVLLPITSLMLDTIFVSGDEDFTCSSKGSNSKNNLCLPKEKNSVIKQSGLIRSKAVIN